MRPGMTAVLTALIGGAAGFEPTYRVAGVQSCCVTRYETPVCVLNEDSAVERKRLLQFRHELRLREINDVRKKAAAAAPPTSLSDGARGRPAPGASHTGRVCAMVPEQPEGPETALHPLLQGRARLHTPNSRTRCMPSGSDGTIFSACCFHMRMPSSSPPPSGSRRRRSGGALCALTIDSS